MRKDDLVKKSFDLYVKEKCQSCFVFEQLLKVAFDNEVGSDNVETLRKLLGKVRNPPSIFSTFAFTGLVSQPISQMHKGIDKGTSLRCHGRVYCCYWQFLYSALSHFSNLLLNCMTIIALEYIWCYTLWLCCTMFNTVLRSTFYCVMKCLFSDALFTVVQCTV